MESRFASRLEGPGAEEFAAALPNEETVSAPSQESPLSASRSARQRVAEWTFDNYQTAYLLGTGLLTAAWAALTGQQPFTALRVWSGVTVFGALVDPCLNPRNVLYGKTLWRGDPERREVALTFDDGPWPPYTNQILDILAHEEVPAAFFLVGRHARRHPDLVHRIRREGHIVGNHTESHCNLLLSTPWRSQREIAGGRDSIAEVLGEEPIWFRPPWGFRSPLTMLQCRRLRQKVAMWTYDPRDWQCPPPSVLTRRVVDTCVPGSVILLHDGNGDRTATVAALPGIIAELRGQGYRLVSLDEMDRERP